MTELEWVNDCPADQNAFLGILQLLGNRVRMTHTDEHTFYMPDTRGDPSSFEPDLVKFSLTPEELYANGLQFKAPYPGAKEGPPEPTFVRPSMGTSIYA